MAIKGDSFSLISTYISPNVSLPIFILYLEEIKSLINQLGGSIVLCGDFNAHAKFWGSAHDSRRGTLLLDYMAELDFCLVNEENVYTCIRAQGRSIIDLTWASSSFTTYIHDWKVDESLESLSDHVYISFSVSIISSIKVHSKTQRWNTRKMNEEDFNSALDWIMYTHSERLYVHDPIVFADWLNKAMCEALEYSTPRIYSNIKKKKTYWWNKDIHDSRRKVIAARRTWCRCRRRLQEDDPHYQMVYSAYKKAKRDLKKLIRRSKGAAWRELISSVNEDPWGLPFKLVLSKLRKSGPGITELLHRKTLNELLNNLFPEGKLLMVTDWSHLVWNPDLRVDYVDVYNIIKNCKKTDSAPGPDGIKYLVWKKVSGITIAKLADCFTLCFKEGIFPDIWKIADLILIPKQDHTLQNPKVRPICLLDTIGKIFEKIISLRINDWMTNNLGASLSVRQMSLGNNTQQMTHYWR